MSQEAQAEATELQSEELETRRLEFASAISFCEERNEFVAVYLAALAEKIGTLRPLYRAACPSVLAGWQCAAFLIACGKENLPIPDGVQTLREFVQFLDDAFVHWR